jgi:hypothetical protein
MRPNYILFLLTVSIMVVACATNKKIEYDFPEAMLPHVKLEYQKQCDKGLALYRMNCGGCHSTKNGRKEHIPDFTPEQLKGYALRISNATHEKNMPDSLVTEEELGIIMTFLMYKKKN